MPRPIPCVDCLVGRTQRSATTPIPPLSERLPIPARRLSMSLPARNDTGTRHDGEPGATRILD
jgi:hypothetical protein